MRPEAAPEEGRLPQSGSDRRGKRGITESDVSYRGKTRNGKGPNPGCGLVSRHLRPMMMGRLVPSGDERLRGTTGLGRIQGKGFFFLSFIQRSIRPSVLPSFHPSTHPPTHLTAHPSVCLSVHPLIHPFTHPSSPSPKLSPKC